jgi:hypothetical protein
VKTKSNQFMIRIISKNNKKINIHILIRKANVLQRLVSSLVGIYLNLEIIML